VTDVSDQRTLKTYLKYLEDCGLILGLSRSGKGLQCLEKPEKIFLNNTNLIYALAPNSNIGTVRETLKHRKRAIFWLMIPSSLKLGEETRTFPKLRISKTAIWLWMIWREDLEKKYPFGFLDFFIESGQLRKN